MANVIIYTTDQVLERGLLLASQGEWTKERLMRQKRSVQINDFKSYFGAQPVVLARLWLQLQVTPTQAARIDTSRTRSVHLKNFLRSNQFLKQYGLEGVRKLQQGNTEKTVRRWCWYFVERIAILRADKIKWPADGEWTTYFIISVDGVQCRYHEEDHPILSKDPTFFAHKFNGPGLGYELALHLFESRLVWLKQNPNTSENDRLVYTQELEQKIPVGRVAIADGGYRKKGDRKLATPNPHDPPELRTFKARARMRQEHFHSRIKRYKSLDMPFRHGRDRHEQIFEAVCVILCFEMELVSPLFDV